MQFFTFNGGLYVETLTGVFARVKPAYCFVPNVLDDALVPGPLDLVFYGNQFRPSSMTLTPINLAANVKFLHRTTRAAPTGRLYDINDATLLVFLFKVLVEDVGEVDVDILHSRCLEFVPTPQSVEEFRMVLPFYTPKGAVQRMCLDPIGWCTAPKRKLVEDDEFPRKKRRNRVVLEEEDPEVSFVTTDGVTVEVVVGDAAYKIGSFISVNVEGFGQCPALVRSLSANTNEVAISWVLSQKETEDMGVCTSAPHVLESAEEMPIDPLTISGMWEEPSPTAVLTRTDAPVTYILRPFTKFEAWATSTHEPSTQLFGQVLSLLSGALNFGNQARHSKLTDSLLPKKTLLTPSFCMEPMRPRVGKCAACCSTKTLAFSVSFGTDTADIGAECQAKLAVWTQARKIMLDVKHITLQGGDPTIKYNKLVSLGHLFCK